MSGRLGILGGTFDPIHLGHTASAIEVADSFDLDEVLLVVSSRPPHKSEAGEASAEDRLAMVRLASARDPRLTPSDLEMRRAAASYTVDTLEALDESRSGAELWFIIGIDAWRDVDTWSRPEKILALANVIVTSRPGDTEGHPDPRPPFAASQATCYDSDLSGYRHESGNVLVGHAIDGLEVSSSEIRERLAQNLEIETLTGPLVAAYIRQHCLYQETL